MGPKITGLVKGQGGEGLRWEGPPMGVRRRIVVIVHENEVRGDRSNIERRFSW